MLNQISKWKGVLNDEECGAEVHIESQNELITERVPDHSTTEEMDMWEVKWFLYRSC